MPQSKTIVILEDDSALIKMLSTALETEGFSVVSAVDGETGLRLVEEKKPALVILDIILPRRSGFEVMEALRARPELAAIPVLVLTNLEGKQDIQRVMELGARHYFVKADYSLEEIVEHVKALLP